MQVHEISRLRTEAVPVVSRALFAFLLLSVCMVAEAASWRFSPSLELAETYSDNITLRPAGKERSDYVTEVTPGFGLSADGRRLNLALNYRWQGLYYARDNEKNSSYHQLGAGMDGTLVDDLFFVDAHARYRQTLAVAGAAVGQGAIASTGNLQNILTTSVSPYLRRKLGGWAETELRYTQSSVLYSNNNDRDSFSNGVDFRLAGRRAVTRWSWAVNYHAQSIDYRATEQAGVTTRQGDLQLGYRLSSRLGLNGQFGREENEYPRAASTPAPAGNFWDMGLDWQPNPRIQVSLGGGKRYYGSNWRLNLSHRGRRTTLRATYSEGLTTRRRYQLALQLDDVGLPIIDVDTGSLLLEVLPRDEIYLRRRAQLNYSYATRRSTTSFSLYQEWREYQERRIDETVRGAGVAWQWAPGRRVDFSVGTDFVLNGSSIRQDDRRLAGHATLTRKLGRYMDARLEARHTRRDGGSDYTENLLTARLTLRW
ncbi:MAG TPA: TIGR03016 family PEP-CTERM system-associated outer membrane protein [Gammaproteobacteria bacterium]|nr:TIGR03016 family PEP-CTERM system-associated outer membrane protein [Gammaproteobacteria bacterium]